MVVLVFSVLGSSRGRAVDPALHGLPIELPVVIDLDRLRRVRHLDKDDLRHPGLHEAGPLEGADVAKEFDDVLLSDALLQVGHDHLGAGQRADGAGEVGVEAVGDGARVVGGLVRLRV